METFLEEIKPVVTEKLEIEDRDERKIFFEIFGRHFVNQRMK